MSRTSRPAARRQGTSESTRRAVTCSPRTRTPARWSSSGSTRCRDGWRRRVTRPRCRIRSASSSCGWKGGRAERWLNGPPPTLPSPARGEGKIWSTLRSFPPPLRGRVGWGVARGTASLPEHLSGLGHLLRKPRLGLQPAVLGVHLREVVGLARLVQVVDVPLDELHLVEVLLGRGDTVGLVGPQLDPGFHPPSRPDVNRVALAGSELAPADGLVGELQGVLGQLQTISGDVGGAASFLGPREGGRPSQEHAAEREQRAPRVIGHVHSDLASGPGWRSLRPWRSDGTRISRPPALGKTLCRRTGVS